MIAAVGTKACRTCARAKRKCGKELLECARCQQKGVKCTYPPDKPSCFVLLQEDADPLEPCKTSGRGNSSLSAPAEATYIRQPGDAVLSRCQAVQPYAVRDTCISPIWFNLPYTWDIKPWPRDAIHSCTRRKIKLLVSQIQQWFAEWISTGSNPFIHSHLYRNDLPRCVQDAYSTLSTYLNRTPDNEHMVFQILKTRLTELLADFGGPHTKVVDTATLRQSPSNPSSSDTLNHLARVQALSTYLILMLFNADDDLRHTAEQHIPVLDSWLRDMVDAARFDMSAESFLDPFDNGALWRAWILAESLRRTWIVGRTIAAQYEMLKAGAPVPSACKGGMAFTTRKGAWEAESAEEWESMAAEVNLGLLQIGDARRWVQWGGISKGEVNSFAKIFLEGLFSDEV